MKKFLLCLLFFASAALAQDAPLVLAPASGEVQISIPSSRSQLSLVSDRRTVSLPPSRSTLRFLDGPISFDKGSLQLSIDRSVAVLEQASGTFGVTSFDLAAFVGKQITLLRPQGSAGEKSVMGKLLSASGPVLLETGEGILLDPPGVWLLPHDGVARPGAGATNGFQWQVEAARGGDFVADALYATTDLAWDSSYTATLSPARDRLSLRAALQFKNETGAAFRGAKLSLHDETSVAFDWPRPITLLPGQTSQIYASTDVAVNESLIYNTESGRDFAAPVNNAHPQRSMTLENTAQNGLGLYLPVGTLSLWQGDSAATLKLDKIAKWGGFRPGEVIAVPLGTENSISLDRFIVSSKLLNPVTREIVVAWKVTAQSGSVGVTIVDNVPTRFKLTNATLKPVTVVHDQLRFETKVSSDAPVEFRYTVEVPA